MNDQRITLVATCPDEDTSAQFRAEVLKLTALYGVQVCELTVGGGPTLTMIQGGGGDGAA